MKVFVVIVNNRYQKVFGTLDKAVTFLKMNGFVLSAMGWALRVEGTRMYADIIEEEVL
jgi:hypothetical protein